jgi:hypothetical protein
VIIVPAAVAIAAIGALGYYAKKRSVRDRN